MPARFVVAFGIAVFFAAAGARAVTQPFGPKTYPIAPNVRLQTEEPFFAASPCDNAHAVYTLVVDVQAATAHVSLNGSEIVVTSGHDAKQVQVTASNTLAIDVTGSDQAGSVTVAVTRSLDIADFDAPVITLNGVKDGDIVTTPNLLISGTVADASAIASLTVNGRTILPPGKRRVVPPPGGSIPEMPSGSFALELALQPGANRITAAAEDCAGNVRNLTITVYYDAAPPQIRITSPASGALIDATTVLAGGTVSDDVGIDHVTVNGVNAILHDATWSATVTFPADGPREISAIAFDKAGRQSVTTIPVTVDTTPPTITASVSPAPNAAGWSQATTTVTFACDDATSGVTTCTGPVIVSAETAGTVVTGTAVDKAGHTTTTSVTVMLDETPPLLNVPAPQPVVTSNATITGNVTDALSGVASVTCNGPPGTTSTIGIFSGGGTFTCNVTGLTLGGNLVNVTATDVSGNVATSVEQVTFAVDRAPPSVTITSPLGSSFSNMQTISVSGTATDDVAVAGVTVNGIAATLVGTNWTANVTLSGDGPHDLVAVATDESGKTATTTISVTVDVTPPALNIESPVTGAIGNNPTVAVTGTVTDSTSGVGQVTCSGVAATVANGRFNCSVTLDEGLNEIPVLARDNAGNLASAITLAQLDTGAPQVSIVSPAPATRVSASTVTVHVNATDDDAIASVTIAGQTATASGSDYTADVPLAEGANQINVLATDRAGNTASAQLALTRYSQPSIAITSPADLVTVSASSITVSGTIGDPAATVFVNGVPATVAGGTFSAPNVPLEQGRTVITAVATNALGHVLTATTQIYRDSIPPRIRVYSPPDGSTVYTPAVSVTGMVDDIVVGTINAAQVTVTVNGQPAQVLNRGFLVTNVTLAAGANTLIVSATDQGGNVTTVQHHLNYDAGAGLAHMVIVSGNDQQAVIGATLPQPLKVKLVDAAGLPAASRSVTFRVVSDRGTLTTGTTGRVVVATTNAQGEATATWTVGTRAGAGTNRVAAICSGFAGTAAFEAVTAVGPPDRVVVDAGDEQFGATSTPLPRPLIVVAIDSGNNRVGDVPVTFHVLGGGGSFGGQQQVVVNTDSDGRAWYAPVVGPDAGNDNNTFEAYINDGASAVQFHASGRIAGDPAQTAISGVIVDNTNLPLNGVSVRIEGTPLVTQTNAQGQFTITGTPAGYVKLFVDGSTTLSTGTWPTLEYAVYPIAGVTNTIGMPIYLLPLDIAHGASVDETHGGTITLPDVPGFSVTILPGSVTFAGGSRTGTISCTSVHPDRIPMAPGFGQQPRFIYTVQPPGAHIDPPAQLSLPNLEGLAPGEITELYSFDHDLGQFVAIGTGSVSDDGSVIHSDPGVGIFKTGWNCGGNPSTTGGAATPVIGLSKASLVIGNNNTFEISAAGVPAPGGNPAYQWSVTGGVSVAFASGTGANTSPSRVIVKGLNPGPATITVTYRTAAGPSASKTMPVTVVDVAELDANLKPTLNVATHSDPTAQPVTTTNRLLPFQPASVSDLMVVLEGAGSIKFTAVNVQPASAAPLLRWAVERNPTDMVSTTKFTQTAAGAASVTAELDNPGNFREIVYVDTNGNGAFDPGEELRVMPFVVVQVTLNSVPIAPVISTGYQFGPLFGTEQGTGVPVAGIQSGDTTNTAMQVTALVHVVGGGANGLIGLDIDTAAPPQMKKVKLGVIANITTNSLQAQYVNATAIPPTSDQCHIEYFKGGVRLLFPLLDTSRSPSGIGGDSAFRRFSSVSSFGNPGVVGLAYTVTAFDAPKYVFPQRLPKNNAVRWTTVTGTEGFRETIVAVADFNQTYLAYGTATWAVSFSGQNDGFDHVVLNSSQNQIFLQGMPTAPAFNKQPITPITPPHSPDLEFVQVYGPSTSDPGIRQRVCP